MLGHDGEQRLRVAHAGDDVVPERPRWRNETATPAASRIATSMAPAPADASPHSKPSAEIADETHVRSILGKLDLPLDGDTHRRVLAVVTFLRRAAPA